MRKLRIAGVGVFALLLIVALVGFIGIQAGPRAAGPSEDPLVRLDREHAGLTDNADELYLAAFAVMVGEPPASRGWHPGTPVPLEAAELVAANREALRLGREAAARANYWHPLAESSTFVAFGDRQRIRRLAKLTWWEAQLAAEQHDSAGLAAGLVQVDRMGRHCLQAPELAMQLSGYSCVDTAQDGLLEPLRWSDLTREKRREYIDCVEPLCMPPPSLAEAYAVDEEAMCWIVASTPNRNALNVVCPLSRCYGEINIAYQTLRALAGQTSEEQAQLDNPLRLKAEAQAADRAFTLNFPRMLTRPALRAMVGPIDLRTRLVTKQRGNRTVLELFRLKDQTGEFPATLDAVTGDFKTDPYSGRPFVYRRAGDDFVLYSVGIDADDDGGTHHARFGERPAPGPDQPAPPPDGDYVFWPIPGVDR